MFICNTLHLNNVYNKNGFSKKKHVKYKFNTYFALGTIFEAFFVALLKPPVTKGTDSHFRSKNKLAGGNITSLPSTIPLYNIFYLYLDHL